MGIGSCDREQPSEGELTLPRGWMGDEFYADQQRQEANYWWHRGKRLLLHETIRAHCGTQPAQLRVIDIGCGTGTFVEEVGQYAWAMGVDAHPAALAYCRQRGVARLCAADIDAPHLPFNDHVADVLVLADCLEHSVTDVELLRECRRVLADDGVVLIVVPAYLWLWSYWDEAAGHQRRYTHTTLRRSVEAAGLSVRRDTYLLAFVLPVAVLWRWVRQCWHRGAPQHHASDFVSLPGVINSALLWWYRLELWATRCFRLPCGLSVVAVCSKRA